MSNRSSETELQTIERSRLLHGFYLPRYVPRQLLVSKMQFSASEISHVYL